MPRKDESPWDVDQREFLKNLKRTNNPQSMRQATAYVNEARGIFGDVNPKKIKLLEMQDLETKFRGNENTRFTKCVVTRYFFKFCLNRDAMRWRFAIKPHPREDIIHLHEEEIQRLKAKAAEMGVFYELFTSLGVDNGLRPRDMLNLTEQNAVEFLQRGWSVIRRKGRGDGKYVRHYLHADTFSPLSRYLDWRQHTVERYGQNYSQLFIMETNYCKTANPYQKKKGQYYIRPLYYLIMWEEHIKLQEASGIILDLRDERATYGFRANRQGLPLEDTAELMAHSTIDVTFKHYIGDDSELKRTNMLKIGAPKTYNDMEVVPIQNPNRKSQSTFVR